MRQQEKIGRYQEDLEELTFRLEEQNEVVAESAEQQQKNEARLEAAEFEMDELKSQLVDYQQALDVQQTRAIQYQQALQALNRARELCQLPALAWEDAASALDMFKEREQLNGVEDCPDDLNLIEGDLQSFDDNVFGVGELQGAVLVKVADRRSRSTCKKFSVSIRRSAALSALTWRWCSRRIRKRT